MGYGFNENELRKTITIQVDKDGFQKKTVTYGKQEEVVPMRADVNVDADPLDNTKANVTLLVVDLPEEASAVYALPSDTDDEWELDIGDDLEYSVSGSYIASSREFEAVGAAELADTGVDVSSTIYYQIYAVDSDSAVVDRLKLTVSTGS